MRKETRADDVLAMLRQVASALEEQSALRAALAETRCQVATLQEVIHTLSHVLDSWERHGRPPRWAW